MENLNFSLCRHLEKVSTVLPNWETHLIGVFLYGSQNYNVHTKNSDVDTKAIYVPTLEQLAFGDNTKSQTLTLENNEHCELMTISHFVNNVLKQNVNFVEVMFTDYFWLNPKWEKRWMLMIQPKEAIARYDVKKAVLSICGQALHTLKQYDIGSDPKKVANAIRMEHFLYRYTNGRFKYMDCISFSNDSALRNSILKLKQHEVPFEQCQMIAKTSKEIFEQYRETYLAEIDSPNIIVENWLHEQTQKIILKGINEYENKKF